MLIKGEKLNQRQFEQVLNAYVHRFTTGNPAAKRVHPKLGEPTQTDQEWVNEHAFHFLADGSRLSWKHNHCEPAFVADK